MGKDEPSDIAATTTTSSNSWEESEFTAEILRSSSSNSNSESVSTSNDVVQGKNDLPVKKTERVGVTVGEDSMFGATNTYSGTNTKVTSLFSHWFNAFACVNFINSLCLLVGQLLQLIWWFIFFILYVCVFTNLRWVLILVFGILIWSIKPFTH